MQVLFFELTQRLLLVHYSRVKSDITQPFDSILNITYSQSCALTLYARPLFAHVLLVRRLYISHLCRVELEAVSALWPWRVAVVSWIGSSRRVKLFPVIQMLVVSFSHYTLVLSLLLRWSSEHVSALQCFYFVSLLHGPCPRHTTLYLAIPFTLLSIHTHLHLQVAALRFVALGDFLLLVDKLKLTPKLVCTTTLWH